MLLLFLLAQLRADNGNTVPPERIEENDESEAPCVWKCNDDEHLDLRDLDDEQDNSALTEGNKRLCLRNAVAWWSGIIPGTFGVED